MFTAGYSLRSYGAFDYMYSESTLIIYILSQVFINICPPLLELANYHVLGRILYYVPHLAPLPPGRILAVFGGLMALVECLNALGVALSADPSGSPQKQTLGKGLILAALGMQLVVIGVFVGLAGVFHRRCARAGVHTNAVATPLRVLYVSMALILVRCVYRLVEHAGNAEVHLHDYEALKDLSPILRYEWFFYVFEATLMLANSALWNIWNPGHFLPKDYRVHLAKDGRTEVKGRKRPDHRSVAAKVAHVLTFGLLFGRDKDLFEGEEGEELAVSRSVV
ncbi:hypothetical protein KJ359_006588 [Pestalotiopsis sp. 9143b]|nr:hypothetical protein KJ359_006588 [Pestalotiopsis sp. 9143b]